MLCSAKKDVKLNNILVAEAILLDVQQMSLEELFVFYMEMIQAQPAH